MTDEIAKPRPIEVPETRRYRINLGTGEFLVTDGNPIAKGTDETAQFRDAVGGVVLQFSLLEHWLSELLRSFAPEDLTKFNKANQVVHKIEVIKASLADKHMTRRQPDFHRAVLDLLRKYESIADGRRTAAHGVPKRSFFLFSGAIKLRAERLWKGDLTVATVAEFRDVEEKLLAYTQEAQRLAQDAKSIAENIEPVIADKS